MKSIFSRHGIPQTVISDNGPQYDSSDMKQFSSSYEFKHVTSSSYYPKGNGLVGRMVKTVKSLLKETSDIFNSPYLPSYTTSMVPLESSSTPQGVKIENKCTTGCKPASSKLVAPTRLSRERQAV